MILNREKTTEKILNGEFPVDLLRALSALDVAVRDLENAGDDDEVDMVPLVEEMSKFTTVVISEFRKAWAVYDTDEELQLKLDI